MAEYISEKELISHRPTSPNALSKLIMECLRLYIGCLPYAAQRAEVEQLFIDSHIPVKSIDISIDPFSGRNPGYCFINFHTEEDVDDALQKISGRYVRDRPVKIRLATPKRGSGSKRSSWWSHAVNDPEQGPSPFVFDRWVQYDTNETWTAPVNEGRRIYVGGMPRIPNQAMLNVEMRKLFRNYDVQAVSKMISEFWISKSDPGDHHYCFVDMATAEDAEYAAAAMNGLKSPDGWKLRVRKSDRTPSKLKREQMHGLWPGALNEGGSKYAQLIDSVAPVVAAKRKRNLKGNWRVMEPMKPARNLEGNWRKAEPVES